MRLIRAYSSKLGAFSLRNSNQLARKIQPSKPVRTRFAPSPTGFLHIGSLRTALYNYLFARSTKGDFLLRLEDTDQKRLVNGLEQNIYDTLNWLDLKFDEGPVVGGPHEPYRQSDRSEIYLKYAEELLAEGKLYRCFCSKERLAELRESAKLLKPPTNVTYDRHCLTHYTPEESELKLQKEPFTVRFKSPDQYPPFQDLLHGNINLQPQINHTDRRYDDFVLLKSDNLPTYHLANVVDDHLMDITHVIRGEEWLPSTPKHISLYRAFNWDNPAFIHLPLLTSKDDQKLSKRSGDIDIMTLKSRGYLKESLINFCVLFGWSPKREANESVKETFTLEQLESIFNVDQLTRGNAKVDFKKLDYFNKHYLTFLLQNDEKFVTHAINEVQSHYPEVSVKKIDKILKEVGPSLVKLNDLYTEKFAYLFSKPNLDTQKAQDFISSNDKEVVKRILQKFEALYDHDASKLDSIVAEIAKNEPKKVVFQSLRYALSGSIPGLKLPQLFEILGSEEAVNRIRFAVTCI